MHLRIADSLPLEPGDTGFWCLSPTYPPQLSGPLWSQPQLNCSADQESPA